MAMSLSHPDPSSSTSIAEASFGTARRGFDQAEVRDFLRRVAAEFGRLEERQRFLEREADAAKSVPDAKLGDLDDETLTRLLGEESIQLLTTARTSGNEIRRKAEEAAARLLADASIEAARVREEADVDASRRRSDANADAEAQLAMAKQQGREMVEEAQAYRERVLGELARRRDSAREQIAQLVQGRDRLLQAFERARVVAVDVVTELQPLGEPDEYVNLEPTTGPQPVMIANSPRPYDGHDEIGDSPIPEALGDLRIVPEDEVIESPPSGDEPSDTDAAADADVDRDASADAAGEVDRDASAEDVDAPDQIAVASDVDDEDDIETADDIEGVDEQPTVSETDAADEATVEEADGVEDPPDVAADEVSDDATDVVVDDAVADVSDDGAADVVADDVVVDLFARLRADAGAPSDDGSAAEADEAEGSSPTDEQTDDETDEAIAGEIDEEVAVEPTHFEVRDDVLEPLVATASRKLKRVLADEQNDVLDALRRNEPVASLNELVADSGEQSTRYADAIADEIVAAVAAGALTSKSNQRPLRKALIAESSDAAIAVLDQWLVDPLRSRLERCIVDGDGDNSQITKKVRAVYREYKTRHIDEQLDDIMLTAHGRGALAGFDVDTPVVWSVDTRHPGCPDCDDNALSEPVAAGDDFPTGHTFAPAHPGCRCLLVAADR